MTIKIIFVSFNGCDNVLDKYFEIPLMDIEQEMLEITNEDSEIDIIMEINNGVI